MSRIPLPVWITLLPGPAALLEARSDDRPGGSYGRGAGAWVYQGGKRLWFRVEELGTVSCCLFLDPTRFPSLLRCWWKPWCVSVPLCAVRASLETPLLVRSATFGTLGMVSAWRGDRLGAPVAVGVTPPCACLSVPLVAGWALRLCADLGSCPPFMSWPDAGSPAGGGLVVVSALGFSMLGL